MTVQTINIGNVVNDGLGDDLRTAFEKVNANFAELFYVGNMTAANATGNAGVGLFKEKVDVSGTSTLVFKTLLAGSNITLTDLPNTIRVDSIDPPAFRSIQVDDESVVQASFSRDISINGGIAPGGTVPDIEITSLGSAITIRSLFPVSETLTNYNFGTISGTPSNIINLLLQVSNIDFGTVTQPSGLNLNFGTVLVP
jgi:hypothetical protein